LKLQRLQIPDSRSLATERQKLALWLAEWRIHQAMRQVSDYAPPALRSDTAEADRMPAGDDMAEETGQPLLAGQIRLLRPDCVNSKTTRPVYVLLLAREGVNSWTIAPFSRFAHPALPGEWKTFLSAAPLRVLCLWNARKADDSILQPAWLCGKIGAAGIASCLKMLRTVRDGKTPTRVETRRTGPPLAHPLDPRMEYMMEEREIMEAHLALAPAVSGPTSLSFYNLPCSTLRKAAEKRSKYEKTKRSRKL